MSLSIGIVGLPNVGKSTLFNALTKKCVPAENYPFCTIEPSVGVVAVPDERVDLLSKFSNSKKTITAAVSFVDIAGLVKGAAVGEGLGNKFLSHIRETDAICEIVRIFPVSDPKHKEKEIIHVYGEIDPIRDIEVINLELILADLETVNKRLTNLEKEVKRGDKDALIEKGAIEKIKKMLEDEELAIRTELSDEEKKKVRQINLLTMKPILYALNKRAGSKNLDEENPERFKALIDYILSFGSLYVVIDAKIEEEMKEMPEAEKEMFRKELGAGDSGIDSLIKEAYKLLGLISFLTTGEDETRAWTIKGGSTAPIAGAAIHTDFQNKFIRAEVINWKDLLDAGSYTNARAKGLVRLEGKEYIVKDGDVIEFKI